MIDLNKIKTLREKTGAGISECREALDVANDDLTKAESWLKEHGISKASKKADRQTSQGVVESYVHGAGKIGVLVEVNCETDFVARNEEFKELAKDIAMHISAMSPKFLSPESVPEEMLEKEREIWTEQLKNEGKPAEIMAKIMNGKEKKFKEEISLLTQPFVKNPDLTIRELITEKIGKIGENIQLGDFFRFEL